MNNSMRASGSLPPPIRRFLGDFVAKSRRVRVARAGLIALALLLAWTLVVEGIDRFVPLPEWVRGALLASELLAAAAVVFQPLHDPLRRRGDWIDASPPIERRNPTLNQRLLAATSPLPPPAGHRRAPPILLPRGT